MRAHLGAFAAGAGAMALELLASRWLAPVFGATLTTWTAVIAVTLGAGALGAAWGGRPSAPSAPAALAVGALLAVGAGLRAPNLVGGLGSLPAPWGALLGALVVLLLPVGVLAVGLPRLIRQAGGARAGGLIASSTLGALAGTLGAGLLAIPTLGLLRTALATAALLLVGAAALAPRRGPRVGAASGLLALLGIAALLEERRPAGLIVAHESLAGRVTLSREARGLALRVDGVLQGAVGETYRDGAALAQRGQHVGLLPYLRPTARRALIVGLGSGVQASTLARHGIDVTTLELDAGLAAVVREHLRVDGTVRVGDGRASWRADGSRWDLIVLDAFRGEGLPGHLLTREAFVELAERLTPGGAVAVHLIGQPGHAVTSAVARTLASVWPERLALRSCPGDDLQDLVLVASEAPLAVPPHPDLIEAGVTSHAVFSPRPDGALLTDDLNPLEVLNEPLARALRERNRAFGEGG